MSHLSGPTVGVVAVLLAGAAALACGGGGGIQQDTPSLGRARRLNEFGLIGKLRTIPSVSGR